MNTLDKLIYWMPRILGILIVLFIGMFAFDTAYNGSVFNYIAEMYTHLLPAAILLAVLIAAWRWEMIGIISYTVLGIFYITIAYKHPDWIFVISGPLFLCAGLFALSMYNKRRRLSLK
jgi:hypothetical protein